MLELIDIGINLTHDSYDHDRAAVLSRAIDHGVRQFIVTGASADSSKAALDLVGLSPRILRSTAGCHPHHAVNYDATAHSIITELLQHPWVVAVGETGLDYHRNFSSPAEQRHAFEKQLDLAVATRKPLFLHQRDAHADFIAMLTERAAVLPRAVLHCFTGTANELDEFSNRFPRSHFPTGQNKADRPHRLKLNGQSFPAAQTHVIGPLLGSVAVPAVVIAQVAEL
jgi:TatD DNase family protein